MCVECLQTPCHPRCPNAPDPPVVHRCSHCNGKIRAGDTYYDIDGEPWCEDCISSQSCTAEEE